MRIERHHNGDCWQLTVKDGSTTLFSTIDDCFGMDRIKDWSTRNKFGEIPFNRE